MDAFLWLFSTLIQLYIYVIIGGAVMSWLIAFNVINLQNQIVWQIYAFLQRVTEPALRPIRQILPDLGGIDISPIILLIGLMFLERLVYSLVLSI